MTVTPCDPEPIAPAARPRASCTPSEIVTYPISARVLSLAHLSPRFVQGRTGASLSPRGRAPWRDDCVCASSAARERLAALRAFTDGTAAAPPARSDRPSRLGSTGRRIARDHQTRDKPRCARDQCRTSETVPRYTARLARNFPRAAPPSSVARPHAPRQHCRRSSRT
jgi:hypothetical protein